MANPRLGILAICALCAAAPTGCALPAYQFGQGWQEAAGEPISSAVPISEPVICQGKPNKFIDGTGWVLGIPGKVMLFDSRVDNHAVSTDTTLAVSDYLTQNHMPDVCVRVNQYAPGEEWRRLFENRRIGAGWRYTAGTLSLIGYTLIPGRLVGGDRYNPYTNSVYVYSDVPSLAIKSAAYAKDVHQRSYPGTYAFANQLPVVSLWHETVTTQEALGYFRTVGSVAQQAEAQRILYPTYCIAVGGAFGGMFGAEPFLIAGGAVVGHVSGRLQAQTPPAVAEANANAPQASLLSEVPSSSDNSPPSSGIQQTGVQMPPR